MAGIGTEKRIGAHGWGAYTPAPVMTNDDWSKWVDTSDEWITSRTGIKERRVAESHETTASMAIEVL